MHCWWEWRKVQMLWKSACFWKVNHTLPHELEITPLAICPRGMINVTIWKPVHKYQQLEQCWCTERTQYLLAEQLSLWNVRESIQDGCWLVALWIISLNCKQLKCSSGHRWLGREVHRAEDDLALKRNRATWTSVRGITPGEKRESPKIACGVIPLWDLLRMARGQWGADERLWGWINRQWGAPCGERAVAYDVRAGAAGQDAPGRRCARPQQLPEKVIPPYARAVLCTAVKMSSAEEVWCVASVCTIFTTCE